VTNNLGPGPIHRSETTSTAGPMAAAGGYHFGAGSYARPLAGLATVLAIVAIFALAASLFRGGFTETVPVTVISQRAGLVMNPDAKVKMHGVQVGKVDSIEERPDGQAALRLAMDPSQLHLIPANVLVDIASSTVFGAKFVQLVAPPEPSTEKMHPRQVLDAKNVTVEINTVFEQLTSVLSTIEPAKLNATLGALASALNGRGDKIGQMLVDLDSFLAQLEPGLPNLNHDIAITPAVLGAYADAAPDLITTVDNATRISQTFVDEQHNLDALLVSVIGLADIGNDVVGTNRQPLTDVLHLLVPTTDLTNRYHESLNCALAGMVDFTKAPPLPEPGVVITVSFSLGIDRYRYPHDLPKVAATGGPHCQDQSLPNVPAGVRPPFLVTDVGSNPWKYGNQGILLNSDALKQMLFGPIDGPPRNTAQIGQPG
jgi:phospholipid/cholesterol/gamma-HCH transport system substrate-binding protein